MWIKYLEYSIPGWSRTFQAITSLISRGYCDIQSLKHGDCDSWGLTQCHFWHWGNMEGKDWKQPAPNIMWSNDDPRGQEWGCWMKGLVWKLGWKVMGCKKEGRDPKLLGMVVGEATGMWVEVGQLLKWMREKVGGCPHHRARNDVKVEEKVCGSRKECWHCIPAHLCLRRWKQGGG